MQKEINNTGKMNEKKICFIMCVNDYERMQEAIEYINRLKIPDGFTIDCLTIEGATSMASGYNEGMNASDAKYKIYMHQDVLILQEDFLIRMIDVFRDKSIGMLGMVGSPELPEDCIMWHGNRVGKIYTWNYTQTDVLNAGEVDGAYQDVVALDGLLIATQYDIRWRDDLFKGWDFYDISSGFEMRKAGFRVVVPYMDKPWVLHDDGLSNMKNYYAERKIFMKNYST